MAQRSCGVSSLVGFFWGGGVTLPKKLCAFLLGRNVQKADGIP